MSANPVPDRIGRYRILGPMGRGLRGTVFRAERLGSRQQVALRTLELPSEAHLLGIRRRLHTLSRLEHPGMARILDGGTERWIWWYALELIEGPTLLEHCANLRQAEARVAMPLILTAFSRLLHALEHLHAARLVLGGLEAESVRMRMASPEPWPVLVDFGVRVQTSSESPSAIQANPTPRSRVVTDLDTQSDLHAVGSLLAEALGATVSTSKSVESAGVEFTAPSGTRKTRVRTRRRTIPALEPAFEAAAPGLTVVLGRLLDSVSQPDFPSASDAARALESLISGARSEAHSGATEESVVPSVTGNSGSTSPTGLSATAEHLARAASILGLEFGESHAVRVARIGPIAGLEAVQELLAAGVLLEGEPGGLRFSSERFREAFRSQVGDQERLSFERDARFL